MIAAVVPAAGRSTRMGRPKLLMEIEGRSMIGRVITALREGGADRVVVVPPVDAPDAARIAAEATAAGAEVLRPERQPAEMRDSVEIGLAALDSDPRPSHVVLTPGDVPGIELDLVARLLREARERPDRIIVPSHRGRRGHPIVLPWEIAVRVRDLPPDAGVNRLVEAHEAHLVEVPVAESRAIVDVDTPEDVERWRADRGLFTVRVRLFAMARDKAGRAEIAVEMPSPARVGDVRAALRSQYPPLDMVAAVAMISVDEDYAGDETPITPASRLALIPPVSGGATGTAPGNGSCDD